MAVIAIAVVLILAFVVWPFVQSMGFTGIRLRADTNVRWWVGFSVYRGETRLSGGGFNGSGNFEHGIECPAGLGRELAVMG